MEKYQLAGHLVILLLEAVEPSRVLWEVNFRLVSSGTLCDYEEHGYGSYIIWDIEDIRR